MDATLDALVDELAQRKALIDALMQKVREQEAELARLRPPLEKRSDGE